MLIKRFVVSLLCFLMVPGLSQADWKGTCVSTADLNKTNPQFVGSPLVMYWKAKVKREIVLIMVKVPETQQILLNFVECSKAEIRDERPVADTNPEEFQCANKRFLGNYWVPLADIEEQEEDETSAEFDLDHPTEYFSSRISFHLQEYADSMKWDPFISSTISNLDQVFLGLFGLGAWRLASSQKMLLPKPTFFKNLRIRISRIMSRQPVALYTVKPPASMVWKRRGLSFMQWAGFFMMLRQSYAIATGARSEFVEERNRRAEHIETLIQQIDERMTMRLDGQDRGQNLEETDGYSALANSIEKANADAFNKFCNNQSELAKDE